MGDGGAVVTHSSDIAQKIRLLREYGWKHRYISDVSGMNSRLDEIQAAILRVKLPFLSENNNRRRFIADTYRSVIGKDGVLVPPADVHGTRHAMHLFVVESDKRDALASFLRTQGIDSAIHYPSPVHKQPAYARYLKGDYNLSVTERLCNCILTLPLYPELKESHMERICDTIVKWRKNT